MSSKPSKSQSPAAQLLQKWFATSRPTPEDAFAQLDEARARGLISREEYVTLLDAEL